MFFTRGYCEQAPDGNDEVHPDIEDGFEEVGIDELVVFSEAWPRVCGFLYKLASFNRGELAFCAFAAGCGADDGRSAPRRKFDEQGATLPLGADRQEQGARLALFLEEVANVLEPQIQVSVLERIDEEIVEVTKQLQYRRSVAAGRGAKRRGGGSTDFERHRGGDSVCVSCAQPSTNRGSDCLNQEQSLEVIKVTSTERESGRILEQIVDVPVPQVMKGIVEIMRWFSLVSACNNAPLK